MQTEIKSASRDGSADRNAVVALDGPVACVREMVCTAAGRTHIVQDCTGVAHQSVQCIRTAAVMTCAELG
jgi:hypothetical protein